MPRRIANRLLRIAVAVTALAALPALALDSVTLQLKGRHQFQFAGYYAAQAQGYYRNAGLDVNIVEAGPGIDTVGSVLDGHAEFGVGSSSLLLQRKDGNPVVVLGVIFQHSPYVLLARWSAQSRGIGDLLGKRVLMAPQAEELRAYLAKEGISPARLSLIEQGGSPQDLIDGKVDAMAANAATDPFLLDRAGFAYQTYAPRAAGIDFYGDNFFTSEAYLQRRPGVVKAFREASLLGWKYAMEHPGEIADFIVAHYGNRMSKEQLLAEARQMRALINPELVAIGYMSPDRWRRIADTYAGLGMLRDKFSLEGFLYEPNPPRDLTWVYRGLLAALLAIGITGVIAIRFARLSAALRREAQERQAAQLQCAASERRYRLIAENTGDVIWLLDLATQRFTYVSPSVAQLRGYTPEEVLAQRLEDAFTPASACRIAELIENGIVGIKTDDEHQHRTLRDIGQPCKDGRVIMTEVVTTLLLDERGVPATLLGVTRDYTEHKRSELALRESREKLHAVVDTAMDAVVLMDAEGIISGWNRQAETIFGWRREEAVGLPLHETIIPPRHRAAHLRGLQRFRACGEGPDLNLRIEVSALHRNGHEFPIELAIVPVKVDGKYEFSSFIRDISERKRADDELKLASLVYQSIGEAILLADGEGRIVAVNPAFTHTTGYSAQEAIGQRPALLRSGRQNEEFYQRMWHALHTTGRWQGEIWNRRKDGELYAEWLKISTIYDDKGAVLRRVAMFSDITGQKRAEETIFRQANYDLLTQLPNRRLLEDRLQLEIKKAQRAELVLAVLFIDLDHFKSVNDTLGHRVGDGLLEMAASRIASCVRQADTVARFGGDEFSVVLAELGDSSRAGQVAQSIIQALSAPYLLGDETVYITASVGITLYPSDAGDVEGLFKNADQAMYVAKNSGRNCYSYFTSALQEAAQARQQMAKELRGALAAAQLCLYFQPIVDMKSGRLFKAEALLRWYHPRRGIVGPGEFIPIAEETGLIHAIGDWVFKESARWVKRWTQLCPEDFQVSVNKSPVQFHASGDSHSGWVEYLAELELPGRSVVIEITEGLLLHAGSRTADKLVKFREAGIQVAIDDFGTGYSALSYLKKFDIDYLKIDQSFVRDMVTDPSDLALSEAIIVMAHKLGLEVIAEGVETPQQRDLLVAAGCDYGQGYLFSRPIPPEEFEMLLKNWNPGALLNPA